MPNWKQEITNRVGDVEMSVLEELAQHLEARYEELGSREAVLAEWDADELRAELARIKQRRGPAPVPGTPAADIWHSSLQDLRYGLRQLRLNSGFAAIAILSLALGIGANTSIFQLLDAVRLRKLPIERPEELANIRIDARSCCSGHFEGHYPQATYAMWDQVRHQQQGFSGVFAWSADTMNLAEKGESRFTRDGLWVSGDFFQVLGVHPLIGRVFSSADDAPSCATAGAVISHAFWQREYGGDRAIVGKKVSVNGHPFDIVGVTPAGFYGIEVGRSYDLALPLCATSIVFPNVNRMNDRKFWWLSVMGRLKPGWTLQRASAQLAAVSPGIFAATVHQEWGAETAKSYLAYKLGAFPAEGGLSDLRDASQNPLTLLQATAGLVLLIACANLANLMLARASARERELAVRLAMGASRWRLIRQLMTESLLVSLFGTVLGALLASQASRLLLAMLTTDLDPLFIDFSTDCRLFAFLAALAFLTCMLFGLAPALKATRTAPIAAMRAGGRSNTQGRERVSLRRALVVSQVALSLMLLIGSLLFIHTFTNLLNVDPGFRGDGIVDVTYDARNAGIAPGQRVQFHRDLLEKVRSTPGVEAAAKVRNIPIGSDWWNGEAWVNDDKAHRRSVFFNRVSPGYFQLLGTPLLSGRDFDDHDSRSSTPVAIVSESFARVFLGGANPVGKRLVRAGEPNEPESVFQIVGLVRDSKYEDLREDFHPIAYFADLQDPQPVAYGSFLVRSQVQSTTGSAAIIPQLKQVLSAANPSMTFHLRDFKQQVGWSMRSERLVAVLSGLFGLLAVALAMAGLYGVISYGVARRTQEIGVRMALGADRLRIVGMILREAGVLLGIGVVAGAALSLYFTQLAESLLYNLHPDDPQTYAAAVAVLVGVSIVASYLPARRASRLDPMNALREE